MADLNDGDFEITYSADVHARDFDEIIDAIGLDGFVRLALEVTGLTETEVFGPERATAVPVRPAL